jgi:histidinol phosphatase-like PHP family hydrolase
MSQTLIDFDYHIHSHHSPCGDPKTTLADIAAAAKAAGIRSLGITDHLNGAVNHAALDACRAEFDALDADLDLHFGVEVTTLREWDHAINGLVGRYANPYGVWEFGPEDSPLTVYLTEDLKRRWGVEYVLGGAHFVLGAPLERDAVIRSYHRQNLFCATHPLVDVVVHPWWWQRYWKDADGRFSGLPWIGDFGAVPRDFHREFAEAVVRNGKAVEINAGAIFTNASYPDAFKRAYLGYLRDLKSWGVRFSLGSDAHTASHVGDTRTLAPVLDALGLRPSDLWRPGG